MNAGELESRIAQLSAPATAEAVKNLRIALQYQWQQHISEEEARTAVRSAAVPANVEALRTAILSEAKPAPQDMERWGKGLLACLASAPELLPIVDQAVDDALQTSSKDFGLSALIGIGVIIVLLKYRPSVIQKTQDGFVIKWKENDVSIVKNLIAGVTGIPTVEKKK